jgi:Ca-activated chloride channel family protein
MISFSRLFPLLATLLMLALAGNGHAQTHVELILDASGSMYNALADGRYRIVAAKDVLTGFVLNLPEGDDLNVGLRVYGSRLQATHADSCLDSELLVPLSGVDRSALLDAVSGVVARGATPIAYSLELAGADFTEPGRYMIVLVTDGEESCGGDIRAVMAALRDRGIDIDLRILGFDLTERASRSFEGIGTFENARTADELAAALGRAVKDVTVVQAALYPVAVTVTRSGVPADDGVTVRFDPSVGADAVLFSRVAPGRFEAGLPAGSFSAVIDDAFGTAPLQVSGLTVLPDGSNAFTFELVPEQDVRLEVSPADPLVNSSVSVSWSGAPSAAQGWITVVAADAADTTHAAAVDVSGAGGSSSVTVPGEPGRLEARFHLRLPEGGSRVIGRSEPFSSHLPEVALTAPAEVEAGSTFEVGWTGPGGERDYITVVPAAAAEGTHLDYTDVHRGNPVTLRAAQQPGEYELRYQSDDSPGIVFARQAITFTAAEYGVQGPASVPGGSQIEVHWTGPDNAYDYITIVPAGADRGAYLSYAHTGEGNPARFLVPLEPGQYELRYSTDLDDNPILASQPIEVTAVAVTLDAPASVRAGDTLEVLWTGPDGEFDYITIVPAGAPEGEFLDYAYTGTGNPVTLQVPDEPGAYEIRYASDSVEGTFASRPIRVE